MAKYYNRGRGNLPLTLTEGRSTSVPGNSWIELEGADQTCPAVMRAVRKGLLYRQPESKPKKTSPAAAEAAPKAAPKPAAKKKAEAKTPATAGDEAGAPAAPDPKPSTAGKSRKTSRSSKK